MKDRLLRLETLLVVVPAIVACLQIYLTSVSDLTRWRGGGFGMYSDAHPSQSRNVWVVGEADGEERSIRLYPPDERLAYSSMRNTQFRRDLRALRQEARGARNFPSTANLGPLRTRYGVILEQHGQEPLVFQLFPRSTLRMVVTEVLISPDFESLDSHLLAERVL